MELTWVEVSKSALRHNVETFRSLASNSLLGAVVKANAYGHGLVPVAQTVLEAGADWLCVNALYEAQALRQASIDCPIYVLGYVSPTDAEAVVEADLRLVVYDPSLVEALSAAASKGRSVPLHIKVETGNNRQGLSLEQTLALARMIRTLPGVHLEGISSHYADIEDTTDHTFAKEQLSRYREIDLALAADGHKLSVRSFSNSAATLLWPATHFELVRVGVSLYGMWPSKETLVSALLEKRNAPKLKPALTWKARIAQVKTVKAGEFVGYGRSFQATHETRLAVIPVGYYDGYDRGLSNLAHVLIDGRIAPLRGRVCMNMVMADVSDIPDAAPNGEVVLLGESNGSAISADQMAEWAHTINYEIPTRINDRIPRILVD